jgi:phage/conjugal plasmid C-4 type zinc finger TraR family protein
MADDADRAVVVNDLTVQMTINDIVGSHSMPARLICDCGSPIPPERREALPNVQTCIDCQEIFERKIT